MWHQLPTPCLESLCLKKNNKTNFPFCLEGAEGRNTHLFLPSSPPFSIKTFFHKP